MKHKNDAQSLVMISYDKIEPMIWERFYKARVFDQNNPKLWYSVRYRQLLRRGFVVAAPRLSGVAA